MFSVKNSDHIDMVIECILQKFAGQVVPNTVLKDYLCKKLPDLFPTGRADRAVEHLANVAFKSTVSKGSVNGVAFLEGIKDGGRRAWKVPRNTDNVMAKSDIALEELAPVIPTRKAKLTFGEYVAATKKPPKAE